MQVDEYHSNTQIFDKIHDTGGGPHSVELMQAHTIFSALILH